MGFDPSEFERSDHARWTLSRSRLRGVRTLPIGGKEEAAISACGGRGG